MTDRAPVDRRRIRDIRDQQTARAFTQISQFGKPRDCSALIEVIASAKHKACQQGRAGQRQNNALPTQPIECHSRQQQIAGYIAHGRC
jgi:hypothetical protein